MTVELSGPGWTSAQAAGQLAQRAEVNRLALDMKLSHLLAHIWIIRCGMTIKLETLHQIGQPANFSLDLEQGADRDSLEHQRGQPDLPSLVLRSQQITLGTVTSSKKISLNSRPPVIWTSGLTVTPGVFMSTSR